MSVFFIADTHFGDGNILRYENLVGRQRCKRICKLSCQSNSKKESLYNN